MVEEDNTQIEHLQENTTNEESISDESLYTKIAGESIRYIQTEKRYLILSIVFPIFIMVFQIVNFILEIVSLYKLDMLPTEPKYLFDLIAPVIIFVVFSIFILIYLSYLLKWNSKVKIYTMNREQIIQNSVTSGSVENSEEFVSLSQIFYDIINHMRNIRLLFYALNIVSVLYSIMLFRVLLGEFRLIVTRVFLFKIPWIILNSIAFIAIIVYLIYQWKFYLKWNKKLVKLDEFERRVYDELEFDS